MRCKKHLADFTSSVGVCASCLHDRLSALIEAQSLAEAQFRAQKVNRGQENGRKSDAHPLPQILFPRSVSPYISHRKSENSGLNQHHTLSEQFFYTSPQIVPAGGGTVTGRSYSGNKQKKSGLLPRLFRSKSSNRTSCLASSSSPSWFSYMLSPSSRKKETSQASVDGSTGTRKMKGRHSDRVMSPARVSECGEEEECREGPGGYPPDEWKQTPQRAATPSRRGGGNPSNSRNVPGLKFCLSPLVRASPNPHSRQKGMPPEMPFHGEVRVPVVPYSSTVKNRSRKIADFGRSNHNH